MLDCTFACYAHPPGIFDPCYFWPDAVYAGDGLCFLLVDTRKNFDDSQVGGITADLYIDGNAGETMILTLLLMMMIMMMMMMIMIKIRRLMAIIMIIVILEMIIEISPL